MELTGTFKTLLIDTAYTLKGSARQLFMARTVKALGMGGQRRAERELGRSRGTMRNGAHELERGVSCIDNFNARGRKRAEDHLPTLVRDITAIVDRQRQTAPQFRTNRLSTRLSAAEVRHQLIAHYGYTDAELPTAETIGTKLNALGYFPKKVAKTQPPKKVPKTDAIFEQVNQINQAASTADDVLRLSMDAKATLKIGPFAQGGKSQVTVLASDHDFQPVGTVTPVGIFLPATDELFLYEVTSNVTSDRLVDR